MCASHTWVLVVLHKKMLSGCTDCVCRYLLLSACRMPGNLMQTR
jgi:hypothetical protein